MPEQTNLEVVPYRSPKSKRFTLTAIQCEWLFAIASVVTFGFIPVLELGSPSHIPTPIGFVVIYMILHPLSILSPAILYFGIFVANLAMPLVWRFPRAHKLFSLISVLSLILIAIALVVGTALLLPPVDVIISVVLATPFGFVTHRRLKWILGRKA